MEIILVPILLAIIARMMFLAYEMIADVIKRHKVRLIPLNDRVDAFLKEKYENAKISLIAYEMKKDKDGKHKLYVLEKENEEYKIHVRELRFGEYGAVAYVYCFAKCSKNFESYNFAKNFNEKKVLNIFKKHVDNA